MSGVFRAIPKLKLRTFTPIYTPDYTSVFAKTQILDDLTHPLWVQTVRRYNQRDDSGLWWSATTHPYGKKRVIRSWICRRLRQAFCEALEARGLDADGKAMVTTDQTDRGHAEKLPDLYGTLRIGANQCAAKAKYEELRKECDALVDALAKVCSIPKVDTESSLSVFRHTIRKDGPPDFSRDFMPWKGRRVAPARPRMIMQKPVHRRRVVLAG